MMMKVEDGFGVDTLASAYLSYTYLEALLLFFFFAFSFYIWIGGLKLIDLYMMTQRESLAALLACKSSTVHAIWRVDRCDVVYIVRRTLE